MTVRPTGLLSPRSGTRIPVPGSDLCAVIPGPRALGSALHPAVVMDSGLAGCVGAGLKPAPTRSAVLAPDALRDPKVGLLPT
jgi:hypothetical protein